VAEVEVEKARGGRRPRAEEEEEEEEEAVGRNGMKSIIKTCATENA
jgi:hypothetical protein